MILKNTNQFFTRDADIHLGSSTYLPINSSILYEGYVSDHPENSSVIGGLYSNCFDGIIQLSNDIWHIEPTRKYGTSLIDAGPSIIYNILDVDMTEYQNHSPFRFKRDTDNEDSSFCGLDDQIKRQRMHEEIDRLSKSPRSKRQTIVDNTERTCCSLYIRIDPTLWDLVYRNEGLHVSVD